MNKNSIPFKDMKQEFMRDEAFRAEYERLQPRYEIISHIIEARKEKNITQSELAKRIGTQKSNISRLESGTYNPSLDFLIKVARGLGRELTIKMK
ncbi:MAG: helix-turn-helix domain-containing protein [Lachnospiraceae bacterium]